MMSRSTASPVKPALLFAGGLSLAQLLAFSVDVYAFRHFEPSWGPAWSLEVLTALALLSAVLGALVFAVGYMAVRLPVQMPSLMRLPRDFVMGCSVGLVLVVEAHVSAWLLGFAGNLTHMVDIGSFVALSLCAGALASGSRG